MKSPHDGRSHSTQPPARRSRFARIRPAGGPLSCRGSARGGASLVPVGRVLALGASLALVGCLASGRFDPVGMDRQPFDPVHPPRLVETVFEVEGAAMNAIVYEAQGPGPHPTVILLHGFPGNEKNLDLAQAMRRAGWNVVFFHYRGSWGSGGRFSFGNILEDVAGVVDAVAGPAFAARHRVDPDRIALVGHSMGGFAALVSAGELERVDCVASLAGANLGVLAQLANASEDGGAGMAARLDGWSGPIRGATGTELVEEVAVHLVRFDTTTHVPVLVGKSVLLIAGRDDEVTPVALHHLPMVEALQAAGARDLQHEVFEASDHSFSGSRIALAHRLVRWLDQSCRPLP